MSMLVSNPGYVVYDTLRQRVFAENYFTVCFREGDTDRPNDTNYRPLGFKPYPLSSKN